MTASPWLPQGYALAVDLHADVAPAVCIAVVHGKDVVHREWAVMVAETMACAVLRTCARAWLHSAAQDAALEGGL